MKRLKEREKGAVISDCEQYRYALWRIWDRSKPCVLFIGLNPSIADDKIDDPTLIRCMGFAKDWGFDGAVIGNLFAYRATDPRELPKAEDPIGPENDQWLRKLAKDATLILAAWGNHGTLMNRSTYVKSLLPELHCLKLNGSGEPAHPLYLKKTLKPFSMV